MKLGIIGLEQSGKTTVFNALTGANKAVGTYGKMDTNIAMVKVPDERVDWLVKAYNPKKIVNADIEFVDIPGGINDSSDPKIVAAARETDALVFVVRAFDNPNVPNPHGTIDPMRDLGYIEMGLMVADMTVTEKRLERLRKNAGKSGALAEEKVELAVLEKIMAQLELEEPISAVVLTEPEEKAIRSFQFLTLKPSLLLLNVSDDDLNSEETKKNVGTLDNCIAMCANTEMEIQTLEEKDRQAFLDDLGIKELTLNAFIRKAYRTLGLISFFTAGESEVHAWTIKEGTTALEAAGKIHSDLERGFIRAEVFNFDDLKNLGSEREVKNAGKFRLEGKEYVVRDGDVLVIKFSV
jgi:ribosome-binding ATPase